MKPHGLADALAGLLEYPSSGFHALLESCRAAATANPEIAASLSRFADGVGGLTTAQLQELYTETFDFSERCTLDIGWHLFGEQHARGVFLSELRPQLAAAGIDERSELPDHLPRLVVLLSKADRAGTAELREAVRRGVEKLTASLHERQSPYEHLVAGAFAATIRGA